GQEKDPHWNEKARAFIKAALMFVALAPVYSDRDKYPLTLLTVKDAIPRWFGSEDTISAFAEICRSSPHLGPAAAAVSMIASQERQSVLSNVLRHVEFLDSPAVRKSLANSDFSVRDLKARPMTVYFVLPANKLKAYQRLARLWIGTLLQAMMH